MKSHRWRCSRHRCGRNGLQKDHDSTARCCEPKLTSLLFFSNGTRDSRLTLTVSRTRVSGSPAPHAGSDVCGRGHHRRREPASSGFGGTRGGLLVPSCTDEGDVRRVMVRFSRWGVSRAASNEVPSATPSIRRGIAMGKLYRLLSAEARPVIQMERRRQASYLSAARVRARSASTIQREVSRNESAPDAGDRHSCARV